MLISAQIVPLFTYFGSRREIEFDTVSYLELIAADIFMVGFIYLIWTAWLRSMDRSYSKKFNVTLWSMDRRMHRILAQSALTFKRSTRVRWLHNISKPWIKYELTDGFTIRLIPTSGSLLKTGPSVTVSMGRCIGTDEGTADRIRRELDASTIVDDRWMRYMAETISHDFIRIHWLLFTFMFMQFMALLVIAPKMFEIFFCVPVIILLSIVAFVMSHIMQIIRFGQAMVSIAD